MEGTGHGRIARLIHKLGYELAAYALNSEPRKMEVDGRAAGAFSDEQKQSAATLLKRIEVFSEMHHGDTATDHVLRQDSETGLAFVNLARQEAGGSIPALAGEPGSLERVLTTIARDVFPSLLANPAGHNAMSLDGGGLGGDTLSDSADVSRATKRHASFDAAVTAATQTPGLKERLTYYPQTGPIWRGPQSGAPLRADMFPVAVLGAAGVELLGRGLPLENEEFVRLVAANIEKIMRLLAGEPVGIWQLVGLSGLQLPAGAALETPWGLIRRASSRLRRVQPFGVSPDCVLEREIKWIAFDGTHRREREQEVKEAEQFKSSLTVLLPLSVLLAIEQDPRGAPTIAWQTTILPFNHNPGMSAPLINIHPRVPALVKDSVEVADLKAWIETVARTYTDHLRVAASRLVSAAVGRSDPADALVDAVVAWEALFGTDHETTFRVTAAMARLLVEDLDQRNAKQKELRKLYDARSKVVHGQPHRGGPEVTNAAIAAGVEVFRKLFRDFPGLLALDQSDKRSRVVLVGDPSDWRDPAAG